MLIMPLEKSIDWAKPPWVTFLLILTCSFFLFVLQDKDQEVFIKSIDYYFSSKLPTLELVPYAERQIDDAKVVADVRQKLTEVGFAGIEPEKQQFLVQMLISMEHDEKFFPLLKNQQIISPTHPEFASWQLQRQQYEKLKDSAFTSRYAFIPAKHEAVTFLSHAFLHGGFGHLFGNMLFLFLIGCAVETALGSFLYLGCYLLVALGSVSFFWLVYSSSLVPLVGASGAISGVMGLYAGIFGLRKIKVFYSVLFYFDYVKVPALTMLPLWIGYEVYQLQTNPGSNVAFMAHIGGFITGGALSLILNYRFKNQIDTDYLDASVKEESKTERHQQALSFLSALNIDSAVRLFQELHTEYPEDREILWQLFKALSYKPNTSEFQQLLIKILTLQDNDIQSLKMIHEAFGYYRKIPQKQTTLAEHVLFKLITKFAKAGYSEDAELIALNFLKKKPDAPDLDIALLAVARSWQQQQRPERYQNCMNVIQKHFPNKKYSAF